MATVKNRGVFRAQGIGLNTTKEELESSLEGLLTTEERQTFTLVLLQLVPACNGTQTQVAIFKYRPGAPPFLSRAGPMFELNGDDVVIDSDFYGLTQLFPVDPNNIKIDIVAISGLNSHAFGSWTNPETDKMWLRDFLSKDEDLKHCRVMTFGYDTKYQSKKDLWIEDHVVNFLTELEKARETKEERKRPLVLIGHSFGGTIVTHAYVSASEGPKRHIYNSITDILFFGVPFRGINLDDVRSMVEEISDLGSQGERVVDYITYEASRETSTIGMFKKLVKKKETRIFSFFETVKTPRVVKQQNGGYSRTGERHSVVVDKNSVEVGISGLETVLKAEGDHSTMVKFQSNQDQTYTTVRNCVRNTMQTVGSASIRRPAQNINQASPGDDRNNSYHTHSHPTLWELRTTDPRDDKRRIEETKGGLLKDSYKWILENPDFQRWYSDDNYRILWISGDPGKGKTMLLCGIIDELENLATTSFYLSYFFCQATDQRINSATAVLRGLIYLLVLQQQSLTSHIQKRCGQAGKGQFDDINSWYVLSDIFTDILHDLAREPSSESGSESGSETTQETANTICLVIDALDECVSDLDRDRLLGLVAEHVSNSPRIKWVVSSRNWPNIERQLALPTNIGSRLSLELNASLVSHAVETYIRYKVLQFWPIKHDKEFQNQICKQLIEKADGTFLWVALVLEDLRTLQGAYQYKMDVLKKLEEIPGGLPQLYSRMLARINNLPGDNPRLCRIILATIALAYRPLQLTELPTLTELGNDSTNTNILGVLVSDCGSFLTLRKGTIYFIHQSAKDFLIEAAPSTIFSPGGPERIHYSMFSSSLQAMSKTLRRNIYNLPEPGFQIDNLKTPDPDPLSIIRYSCTYWQAHLREGITGDSYFRNNDDYNSTMSFLQKHFLYWLEALSLMGLLSESVKTIESLLSGTLAEVLRSFLNDAKRFILMHRSIIEKRPLQLYSTCLFFSPRQSLVRKQNWGEVSIWVKNTPAIQENWGLCLQLLKADDTSLAQSFSFSPDGKLIASYSKSGYDKVIRLWDVVTGSLHTKLDNTSSADSVLFSPDNKLLAALFYIHGTTRLWDIATGTLQALVTGQICRILFSPDGRFLAYGSRSDRTIGLWDTAVNALHAKFNTSPGSLISFSPDSTLVATWSGYPHTVRLWNTANGILHLEFDAKPGDYEHVSFSPDSKLISLCFGKDRTLGLWSTTTGILQAKLENHIGSSCSIPFSPDGKLLASFSDSDTIVNLWNTATGTLHAELKGHASPIQSVLFSPNSELLASIDGSGDTIRLWNSATGALHAKFKNENFLVKTVSFSFDSRFLLCLGYAQNAGRISSFQVWDTATKALKAGSEGYLDSIGSVSFSPVSTLIASASLDGNIKLWSTEASDLDSKMENDIDPIDSILSPDGTLLVSNSESPSSNTIRLWDTVTGVLQAKLEGHPSLQDPALFSPDSKLLAFYSRSLGFHLSSSSSSFSFSANTIRLWNTANGVLQAKVKCQNDSNNSIFSPDSTLLASYSTHSKFSDNIIRLWNTANGTLHAKFEGHTAWISYISFSSDSELLASYSRLESYGTIRIWNIVTKVLQAKLENTIYPIGFICFSHDKNLLITRFESGKRETFGLWNIATKTLQSHIDSYSDYKSSLSLSPNGMLLASSCGGYSTARGDNTIRLWDTITGALHTKFEGHTGGVDGICFSPDGKLLASWSRYDNTIRFWDVVTEPVPPDTGQAEPQDDWAAWRAQRIIELPPNFRLHTARFRKKGMTIQLLSGQIFHIEI
ncbi:hypothetical protein TWF281_011763 [Arthrobotrys megalospora]